MKANPTSSSGARSFAGLLRLDPEEPEWRGDELWAILEHQLQAPLPTAPKSEVRTFGELFTRAAPPIELLERFKEFAKSSRLSKSGPLPQEVATVLYYAAIAIAWVRHAKRITQMDDAAMRGGIEWARSQDWVKAPVRTVLEQALARPEAV